jgi:hypothetical protein
MVMVFCPCGWKGSAFELAARASGAVEGEDGHLVIFVSDKPPEKEPEEKMQCPSCGLDFEKMADWMHKNIPIEDIV